ncbi:hypothetical protein BDA99DRAFT_540750 [Phascolomyces articulosus]|uniref:Uncharacterized protein n=1 Tax=Phascolomyces articulosus TaxID=60185 RepID=A0AAD5JTX0_9FUNG|nr:hypothetical protein BDA99DRAFT_540750 [Phascolomyces articulosus]
MLSNMLFSFTQTCKRLIAASSKETTTTADVSFESDTVIVGSKCHIAAQQKEQDDSFLDDFIIVLEDVPSISNKVVTTADTDDFIMVPSEEQEESVVFRMMIDDESDFVLFPPKFVLLYDASFTYRHGLVKEVILDNIMPVPSWNGVQNLLEIDLSDLWEQDVKGLWRCVR